MGVEVGDGSAARRLDESAEVLAGERALAQGGHGPLLQVAALSDPGHAMLLLGPGENGGKPGQHRPRRGSESAVAPSGDEQLGHAVRSQAGHEGGGEALRAELLGDGSPPPPGRRQADLRELKELEIGRCGGDGGAATQRAPGEGDHAVVSSQVEEADRVRRGARRSDLDHALAQGGKVAAAQRDKGRVLGGGRLAGQPLGGGHGGAGADAGPDDSRGRRSRRRLQRPRERHWQHRSGRSGRSARTSGRSARTRRH